MYESMNRLLAAKFGFFQFELITKCETGSKMKKPKAIVMFTS